MANKKGTLSRTLINIKNLGRKLLSLFRVLPRELAFSNKHRFSTNNTDFVTAELHLATIKNPIIAAREKLFGHKRDHAVGR